MIRTIRIERDVVALSYSVSGGKVTLGKMSIVPLPMWQKLYVKPQNSNSNLKNDETIR